MLQTCLHHPCPFLQPVAKSRAFGSGSNVGARTYKTNRAHRFVAHAAQGQVWAELDEEPADQEVTSEQGEQYSAQYVQLKKEMLGRTQRFAGLLAAYLFLTVSLEAALCALLGSASSYAYLVLMQRQVDAVSATDAVPMWDAEDNVQGIARPFAIGLAAYRAAFRPRQLILVSLAAGIWACTATGLHNVTRLEEGCLLLGFLSYKAPLLLCIWDTVKPRFDAEAASRPVRPVQYSFEEEEDKLDDIMANIASVRNIKIGR